MTSRGWFVSSAASPGTTLNLVPQSRYFDIGLPPNLFERLVWHSLLAVLQPRHVDHRISAVPDDVYKVRLTDWVGIVAITRSRRKSSRVVSNSRSPLHTSICSLLN